MTSRDPDRGMKALEGELLGEAALSLGIAGRRMAEALALLAACPPTTEASERRVLLAAAAEATYAYVVQREALGWRDTDAALDHYGVPAEVRARLGVRTITD